ncbi:unnamed protein product [Amoebophrya sp. A25]|nr:unnamed protein product [Amoebophrya sp. A25]|eukprot:GSA25T00019102001.1
MVRGRCRCEGFVIRYQQDEEEGGSWERYLLLNKFFNVGETKNWLVDDLSSQKIVRIQDKSDGSIIRFIPFSRVNKGGDVRIRAKSKMSFESPQATMATEVCDNCPPLQAFLLDAFRRKLAAVFELVSPDNQIVVPYASTNLVLLHIRSEETGAYFTAEQTKE